MLAALVGAGCFIGYALVLEQLLHAAVFSLFPAITLYPAAYTAYGCLAAGLFEETGRLMGLSLLCKKDRDLALGVGYGIGHGGGKGRTVDLLALLPGVMHDVERRRLEPREGQIEGMSGDDGPRQAVFVLVPALREPVEGRSARIGQRHDPCYLVKGLSGRVVPGRPEDLHFGVILNIDNKGMSARGYQRRKGRFELGEGHIVGGDVAPYVVDRHEGLFQHEAARLGEVRADQQRAYKPRRACRRHGVEVGKLYPGLPDGLPTSWTGEATETISGCRPGSIWTTWNTCRNT